MITPNFRSQISDLQILGDSNLRSQIYLPCKNLTGSQPAHLSLVDLLKGGANDGQLFAILKVSAPTLQDKISRAIDLCRIEIRRRHRMRLQISAAVLFQIIANNRGSFVRDDRVRWGIIT